MLPRFCFILLNHLATLLTCLYGVLIQMFLFSTVHVSQLLLFFMPIDSVAIFYVLRVFSYVRNKGKKREVALKTKTGKTNTKNFDALNVNMWD